MKKTKLVFWVSTVFIFLFEGVMPMSTLLFAPQYTNVGTSPLGYLIEVAHNPFWELDENENLKL